VVDALAEWSQRHGGYDVSRSLLVRTWVRAMTRLGRPLAVRGVPADAVTAVGVAAAVAAARAPRRMAASLVLLSAVIDGLDGAVAAQQASTGVRGVVADRVADRTADVLFAVVLRRAGCPRGLAVASAAASLGFEGLRDVRRARGRGDIGTVTVAERPMRVAAVVIGLVTSPTAAAAALVMAAAIGARQLAGDVPVPTSRR
jgi:phosphatidylglycerophosphate synthase